MVEKRKRKWTGAEEASVQQRKQETEEGPESFFITILSLSLSLCLSLYLCEIEV
jgi:hypothetical protein